MRTQQDIDDQKKFYKNDSTSICRKCEKVNEDCFHALKLTERAKDSQFSSVKKCGSFKERQDSRK